VSGILIIGASGLAREVLAAGLTGVTGILDDDPGRHGTEVGGVPVLGSVSLAAARSERLLVCIGPGVGRRVVVRALAATGVGPERYADFTAPTARVGRGVAVGRGSILLDGVVATADASIGAHVVVMPNSVITHDDVVGDFATLAAGVALGGDVRIGEAAYLGMNASVRPHVRIGRDAALGMGAVALTDIPDGETWIGVPARSSRVRATEVFA